MNEDSKARALSEIAEEAVPSTTNLWSTMQPRVAAKAQESKERRRAVSGPSIRDPRHLAPSPWPLRALAALVVLALVVGGLLPLVGQPEPVSAAAILDRTQSTVEGTVAVQTYHLKMTRQALAKGNHNINTEVWFGGSDRQRTSEQVRDASGVVVSSSEIVFNGDQAWIATIDKGQARVVHTIGTEWGKLANDLSLYNSLNDVLARYSNDKGHMTAQLQGEATILGRATYVIVVTPKEGDAGDKPTLADEAKAGQAKIAEAGQTKDGQAKAAEKAQVANNFGRMTMWVDKQTYLPLKTEVQDTSGAVVDRSEVTSVEYNVAIADATFTYTPPAGATVSTFTGGTGADVKAALSGDPQRKTQPNTKK